MVAKDEIMGQVSITNSIQKSMAMFKDHADSRRKASIFYKHILGPINLQFRKNEPIEEQIKAEEKKRDDLEKASVDLYDVLISMEISVAGVGPANMVAFNEELGRFIKILQKRAQYTNDFLFDLDDIEFFRPKLLQSYLTCVGIVEDDYALRMRDGLMGLVEYIHDGIKIFNRPSPAEFLEGLHGNIQPTEGEKRNEDEEPI